MNRNEYSPLIFFHVIVIFLNVIITSRETNPDKDGEQSDFNIFLSVPHFLVLFFFLAFVLVIETVSRYFVFFCVHHQ